MRIALVTDYYLPTLGGVQTAVASLKNALTASGHRVTVFCPLATRGTDADVVGLPVSPVFRPDGYPFAWSPRALTRVMQHEFVKRGIDVVHTHSEMFAALSGIRAARSLGIPVVHTMHGRIDVYTASVLPVPRVTVPLLAALHARQLSHRGLSVRPGAAYTSTSASRSMWRLMLAQSRASDQVIVPSRHFARKLIEQGVRTPVTVLSNGLDGKVLDAIGDPVARTLNANEPLRLIWVGRLSPEKRPRVLADAARSFGPGVSVDVYGDGISRAAIERMRAPVTLQGPVPQCDVLAAMRASHLLVSTSWDFDNQPMVMLEAIATGLPVLYCDPELAEVIPAGGGFLTETPDAAGVRDAIIRLRRAPDSIHSASIAMIAARAKVAYDVEPTVAVYEAAIRSASGSSPVSDPGSSLLP